ncbi:MAG: RraA family protein [Acidobacteria bacterium]|nr:RraA family protein [Acidobacteriota bacterium]
MRIALFLLTAALACAQTAKVPFSQHMLRVTEYTQQQNETVVQKFQGLRLTDVVDALDEIGLQDITVMDHGIKPLWRDEQKFTHRVYGVAVTVRLVPAQERAPIFLNREDYYKWKTAWTQKYPRYKQAGFLTKDTILVMEVPQGRDVGQCGSENSYGWFLKGMRGIVTEGGCRDTDELILERVPVYERAETRGVYHGRVIAESWNAPVTVGGVLVMPNDVIVADGNGVAVVPRKVADEVVGRAHKVQDADKPARLKHYRKASRPPDFTVK